MTSPSIWPLHPPPSELETFNSYVKRLARLYDTSYHTFCTRALKISPRDREALSLKNPSNAVLKRLSAGVGVPVADLRKLHPDSLGDRHMHLFRTGGSLYGREMFINANMCRRLKFLK